MSTTRNRFSHRYRKAAAGATAAVAAGALLAGCGSSQSTATTATPAAATASTGAPSGAQGTPPALGKVVTGAAAGKAKAAALAKYPGTVERVMQLSDGSYVVHVIGSSGGEVHVKVSKTFAVAGTEQGMPGGGPPPSSGTTTS